MLSDYDDCCDDKHTENGSNMILSSSFCIDSENTLPMT